MKENRVLGLQYYGAEMEDYHKVVDLAKKNSLSLSKTGKMLVNRGLQHTNNPEPLVKPKIEKQLVHTNVHANGPDNKEHIGEDPKTQLQPSGDKLLSGDKASSSQNALNTKKSPPKDRDNSWLKWGLIGIGVYVCYKVYPLLK